MDEPDRFIVISIGIAAAMTIAFICIMICSCTVNLQNISTHGSATDLVDENLSADADVDTTIPAGV